MPDDAEPVMKFATAAARDAASFRRPVVFDANDRPVWADILIDEDGLKVMQRVRLYSVVVVEEESADP